MDRRQKKTKKAIYEAFTKLLEKKSFSNITVQEIIDEADIGRSTFYSHFETKDDLLNDICNGIFEHVFSENLSKEKSHDFSIANSNLDYCKSDNKHLTRQTLRQKELINKITHILYHFQDNKSYIKPILSCESGEIFMRYFKEHIEKLFKSELKKQSSKIPESYLLNHMVCDFAETVRWWMKNENYSPEEISSFFTSTTLL